MLLTHFISKKTEGGDTGSRPPSFEVFSSMWSFQKPKAEEEEGAGPAVNQSLDTTPEGFRAEYRSTDDAEQVDVSPSTFNTHNQNSAGGFNHFIPFT